MCDVSPIKLSTARRRARSGAVEAVASAAVTSGATAGEPSANASTALVAMRGSSSNTKAKSARATLSLAAARDVDSKSIIR